MVIDNLTHNQEQDVGEQASRDCGLGKFAPIFTNLTRSVESDQCSTSFGKARGRGREAGCPAPPAQIPACATNAPGSSLGSIVGR